MPALPRHAIVSFRVTPTEHEQLRAVAKVRGLSLSDLIRSFLARETAVPGPAPHAAAAPAVVSVDGLTGGVGGVMWVDVPGAVVDGSTMTLSAG